MKSSGSQNVPVRGLRLPWLGLIALAGLILLLAIFVRLHRLDNSTTSTLPAAASAGSTPDGGTSRGYNSFWHRSSSAPVPTQPAEEIVAEKVLQFARGHEALVAAMAKHLNVAVPEDVNRFFAALKAGHWEETTNLFAQLKQLRQSENRPSGLEKLWPAVMETYGAAQAAHNWPAQQLLDYGNAILGSLRPGTVYVGGTDAGRFIPTLLTETGEGPSHIVLTQNALADMTYLEYVSFRYGDQLNLLTSGESQKGFQNYLEDALKRLLHDQNTPDGPRQIRPGEDIRMTEGRVQVSGQVAVMSINEILLQTLMQKNPDTTFALQESFPFKSLYAEANVLGPITELRANASAPLMAETAAQSLDYWRTTTQSLQADPATTSVSREAFAKLLLGQANLFVNRELPSEAEQAYRLANSLNPASPEGVSSYVSLLTGQGRINEARQVAQNAVNVAPDNEQLLALLNRLNSH